MHPCNLNCTRHPKKNVQFILISIPFTHNKLVGHQERSLIYKTIPALIYTGAHGNNITRIRQEQIKHRSCGVFSGVEVSNSSTPTLKNQTSVCVQWHGHDETCLGNCIAIAHRHSHATVCMQQFEEKPQMCCDGQEFANRHIAYSHTLLNNSIYNVILIFSVNSASFVIISSQRLYPKARLPTKQHR